MEWKAKQIMHEGLPLMLRYRDNCDGIAFKKRFSKLVAVCHQLSKVSPNGLPEPDYNDNLLEFDTGIQDLFEMSQHGVIVFVETFNGERNYYAYADSKDNVSDIIASLERKFPQEHLSWTIHPDTEWNFMANYLKTILG